MEKARVDEIAIAVAMVEHYQEIIDNAKEELRGLTEEEIKEINKGNNLIISREDYTKTSHSNEYKQAVKEIEKKFPPTKETFPNYKIKLHATSYTISKAQMIIDKFAPMNKTQLKAAANAVRTTNKK